jgi:hypothetical protein
MVGQSVARLPVGSFEGYIMPFQPINFANIEPQGNPFFRDFVDNLASGYKAGQLPAQLARQKQKEELANKLQEYLVKEQPQKFDEESQGRQLKNTFQTLLNQEQPQKFGSEMSNDSVKRAFEQAQTGKLNTMTPLEARELALKNQFYPEYTKSQIANNLALSKQRQLGYGVMNAGGKEELFYANKTQEANPNLTQEQLADAINRSRQGQTTLSDGKTPINITEQMARSADRIEKYGTTGSLITQAKTGEQAEKEIGVLNEYIANGMGDYGDTFYGYSPKAIRDSFSNKKEDQQALGRLMAAMQLQVERAAVQERLATNKSTATITEEILKHAQGEIKANWPFVSQAARLEQNRYLKEALSKGLAERKKIKLGIGKVNTTSNANQSSENREPTYNRATGRLE